jgi:uncharacterized protein YjbI with pentapeptide repeats
VLKAFPWLEGIAHRADTQFLTKNVSGGRLEQEPSRPLWLEEITLRKVDFSGVEFGTRQGEGGLTVHACLFEDCDFRGTAFHVASLAWGSQSIYRRCVFDRAELQQVLGKPSGRWMAFSLDEARFESCTFLDAEIRGWLAHEADFGQLPVPRKNR